MDIFFVISGFLITSILLRDMSLKTYSITDFYERRIRRIFPALFAVLLFVLLVSPFALLPEEYEFLPKEIIGTLLFISNIVSWRKSGYFSTDSEERPLLHTWFLGVEEQFYIFAPIILFIILIKFKRSPGPFLIFAFICSFLLSVFLTSIKPTAAFYLLPTRAWELIAGSLLALNISPKIEKGYIKESISLIGLICILYSVFSFGSGTVFPGYAAALPVFGSMCIIYAAERTLTGKLLSLKPVVFIGLISYSLYLWHWPLIVFFKDWNLLGADYGRLMVIVISLIAAYFSWRFIEKPFRNRAAFPPKKLYTASACGLSLLLLVTAMTFMMSGWPGRFSEQTLRYVSAHEDSSPAREHCHFDRGVPKTSDYCHFGTGTPSVAVWGDSHGAELSKALGNNDINVYEITYSACPPALNYQLKSRPSCMAHNDRVNEFLKNNKDINVVIMAARYQVYPNYFYDNLNKTAMGLISHGKKVIIVGPVPTPGVDVPTTLARGRNPEFIFKNPAIENINKYIDPKVIRFMPSSIICKDDKCNMLLNGKPLLFDDNHLSMSSADYMAKRLIPLFNN